MKVVLLTATCSCFPHQFPYWALLSKPSQLLGFIWEKKKKTFAKLLQWTSRLLPSSLLPSGPESAPRSVGRTDELLLFYFSSIILTKQTSVVENICFTQPPAHKAVWSCARKGPRHVTLASLGTVGQGHLGKDPIPRRAPMRTACSHFTQLSRYRGGGGHKRSGVCGHAPEDAPNRIHTRTLGGKTKQGPLGLPVRHLYVCKQDVGGRRASHGGTIFLFFVFFVLFFFFWERHSPHRPVLALSARAENRQLGGPVKVRSSASYISSPLSRAAELTSALIIAAGLWRRSLRTPGGKPWARMRQWKAAWGRASDWPPPWASGTSLPPRWIDLFFFP